MMHTPLPDVRAHRFETRFGPLEAKDPHVVEFPEGIPGFEACRRWVLIGSEELAPLRCLLSLDAPEPSFLSVDPAIVIPGYLKDLDPSAQVRIDVQPGDTLLWLAIVTLNEPGRSTVNLKAPVVINTSRMLGRQVILDSTAYPVDCPL